MSPRLLVLVPLVGAVFFTASFPARGQVKSRKEIDIGYASLDSVKPVLERVLSPAGKFVLLPGKGSVLVIDDISKIAAAERALANAALPKPNVNLNFAFQTGLPSRRTRIQVGREVFFPTAWDPPQIPNVVSGSGPFPVTPAHPTGFVKRNIGFTSDTVSTVNPDGSITMGINMENTDFEGFINYGSAIMPAGQLGTVPVNGQAGNPLFFQSLIPNHILMPIISTTRISTSVVIRPRVDRGVVTVDMIPRFKVFAAEEGSNDVEVDLKQFQTTVTAPNNGVGRVYGFTNAGDDFNRNFLGARDLSKGGTAIVIRAGITPGSPNPPPAASPASPVP